MPADGGDIAVVMEMRLLSNLRTAHLAWLRSVGETIITTSKEGSNHFGDYEFTSDKTQTLVGDPRFLVVINDCIDKILRLRGAYKKEPDKAKDIGLLGELVQLLKPPEADNGSTS